MINKYPFTEEEMRQVFETSLIDFAINNGFKLKESDYKTFKVENMGGLFIFKDGKGFYQFTTGKKGNIVDFAKEYLGLNFKQAVENILGIRAYGYIGSFYVNKEKTKKPFELPPKAENFNRVIAYLVSKRKIDREIINECIKNNVVAVKEYAEEEYLSEGIVKDVIKAGMDLGITGAAAKGVKYALAHAPLPLKVIAIIIAAGIAIIKLIDLLRIVAYYWMHSRMRLSDWFAIQSDYLRINAENLKYRDDDRGDDHKKAVYQSQMKWVERFKTLSNIIAVKDAKAKKEASDDNNDYSRKRQYDDDDDNNSDDDGGLF